MPVAAELALSSVSETVCALLGRETMRLRFPLMVAVLWALGGCAGPDAEGYFSGGIAGFACPPGTEADGSCGDPDCGVPCVATSGCGSEESCPDGTVCDASVGYCMPDSCADVDDCDAGEACETSQFSQGVCLATID